MSSMNCLGGTQSSRNRCAHFSQLHRPFLTCNPQTGIQDKPYDEEYPSTSDPPPVPPLNGFKQSMDKASFNERRHPSEASLDNTITGRSDTTSPSRRKPSQDGYNLGQHRSLRSQDTTGRRSEDRQDREFLIHRPTGSISESTTSNGNAQSATSGVIIPNKSTIAEEEIEVPYGRQIRDSASTAMLDDGDRDRNTDGEQESSPMVGGLNGLSARLKQVDDVDTPPVGNGTPTNGEDYFDRASYGRVSVASDRSASRIPGEEEQRLRREYEYKIATMQNRIAGLERDLEDAGEKERRNADGNARAGQLEQELNEFRKVCLIFFWLYRDVQPSPYSEPMGTPTPCALYRRSWRSYERTEPGIVRGSTAVSRNTRKSHRSSEIAVRL